MRDSRVYRETSVTQTAAPHQNSAPTALCLPSGQVVWFDKSAGELVYFEQKLEPAVNGN
jgi:hypothetical protein